MKNWQVAAVVEIANLQSPRKKITVEYFACCPLGKHVRTREVKYRTHVEAGFEVYGDNAVCNFFICVI